MALNYTNLFTDLGKIVKHFNLQGTDGSNLDADATEIIDQLESTDQALVVQGVKSMFEGWKAQYRSRRGQLVALARRRLQDKTTVLDQIGATSADMSEVLTKLVRQMNLDDTGVTASTVTLGTVTAASANVGSGTVVADKVLDGYNSPGVLSGITLPAQQQYKDLQGQMAAPSETMTLACVGDAYQDKLTEGSELFRWEGGRAVPAWSVESEGSGLIGDIRGAHAGNILTSSDFESFSSNVPVGWTLAAGTAGTHVIEETSASNVAHGSKSLRLKGDGALAAITLTQAIAASQLTANRRYLLAARIKGDAAIGAGDLTIKLTGTGLSYSGLSIISLSAATLSSHAFTTLRSCFFNAPATLPSDMKLEIKWQGTPTLNKNIYLDDLVLCPVGYGGGVIAMPVRGPTPFNRLDRFTVSVLTVNGVFQTFFRRAFGVQLPTGKGTTVNDALAS